MATLVDPPRSVHKKVNPLSANQARAFIKATHDDRLGPLFTVAILTGLRQGELFGLRWQDVDFAGGTLSVRHAMQRVGGKPTFVEPKSERSRRTLTLPAMAAIALKRQRIRQIEDKLVAGDRWQEANLVFTSTVGTPLEPSNVTARLHKLLAATGLPRQRFHDLRHCCASLLLAQHVSPRVVMDVLGHSQIALTMNTYSHVMPAMLQDAADALDILMASGE